MISKRQEVFVSCVKVHLKCHHFGGKAAQMIKYEDFQLLHENHTLIRHHFVAVNPYILQVILLNLISRAKH